MATIVPSLSNVQVLSGAETATVSPSGSISFDTAIGGVLRITSLTVDLPDFSVGAETVAGTTIMNTAPGVAAGPPDTNGAFSIPGRGFPLAGSARVNGALLGLEGSPPDDITGTITGSTIALRGTVFAANGVVVTAAPIIAQFNNRPPRAEIGGIGEFVECSTTGGANVALDATPSTDPDGNMDIVTYAWFEAVNGELHFLGEGANFVQFFALGSHQVSLFIQDTAGHSVSATAAFIVRNTVAPAITVGPSPSCLYPPNHKMVLYELVSGLGVSARSLCDPSPSVVISSVLVNQPFLGGGQGNTTPDVKWGTSAACLRSERQGTSLEPRIYTIVVTASDHQGNNSTVNAEVSVPHDQRQRCRMVEASRIVEDDDPRCTQSSSGGASMQVEADSGHLNAPARPGCASAEGLVDGLLLLVAMFLRRARSLQRK